MEKCKHPTPWKVVETGIGMIVIIDANGDRVNLLENLNYIVTAVNQLNAVIDAAHEPAIPAEAA